MRLLALGTLDLRGSDGQEIASVLAQPKRSAVLLYLALATPTGYHRRDTLLALFWPELDPERARVALNKSVHYLRRSLGPELIQRRGDDEIGIDWDQFGCDALDFRRAFENGEFERAMQLYRGELLPGFFISEAPEFEHWLDAERRRLRERARAAAARLVEEEEERGNRTEALHWARRALELNPLDETAFRRLAVLLDRSGDRAGVVESYESFLRVLTAELGTEASPETQELVAEIRERDDARGPTAEASIPEGSRGRAAAAPATDADPPLRPFRSERWDVHALRPEPVDRNRRSDRRVGAWIAVALVMVVAVAGAVVQWTGFGRQAESDATVAVLPFTVYGSERYAYLREGIADLLATGLETAGGVRAVNSRAVNDAVAAVGSTRRVEESAQVAERLNARVFVTGEVLEAEGRLLIRATVFNRASPSEPLERVEVEGDASELFRLVEDLTRKVLIGVSREHRLGPLRTAELATESSQALRAYLEGEREYHAGRYVSAAEAFHRAVRADTAFAVAYLRLSNAANWTGDENVAGWAAFQATEFAESASPREQLRIRAWQAYLTGRPDTAASLYRSLLDRDSLDAEAWFYLGEVQYHWLPVVGRPVGESRRAWEKVVELDPGNVGAMIHLARLAAASGDRAGLERISERVLQLEPESDRALELRLLHAFAFGDREARRVASSSLTNVRNRILQNSLVSTAAWTSSDLDGIADDLARRVLLDEDNPAAEIVEHLNIVHAYAARGQMRAARGFVDTVARFHPWGVENQAVVATLPHAPAPAAELARLRSALAEPIVGLPDYRRIYLVGLLSIRQGSAAAAHAAAAELDVMGAAGSDTEHAAYARDAARLLRAETALAAGRPEDVLEALEPIRFEPAIRQPTYASHPYARARWLRAEALRMLGRSTEALRAYASFPSPQAHDVAYLPSVLARRAELLARSGRRTEAAAQYTRLLGLWRDADEEYQPILREVRDRLRELAPAGGEE